MNGKMAKMLRNLGRDSKYDKRNFNALDHITKGILRKSVDDMVSAKRQAESTSHEVVSNAV